MTSEHDIQRQFFDWAKSHQVARRAYAVPNAAKRSARLASYMISEGLRKGVLDIHLPVPAGDSHGLFIEFKSGKNYPTPEQALECELLVKDGYTVLVAWDAVMAIEFTKQYLAGSAPIGLTLLKPSSSRPKLAGCTSKGS